MLYGGMGALAMIVTAALGDYDIYRIAEISTWEKVLLSPLLGIAVGAVVVLLSRVATRRFNWARGLHRDFRSLLGPLETRDIWLLAAASSIGEELVFRGALLPLVGVWPQAILFALLHIGPGKRFLPWTLSALLAGAGFGALTLFTGDLGAAITAHFVINLLNLRYIVRVEI